MSNTTFFYSKAAHEPVILKIPEPDFEILNPGYADIPDGQARRRQRRRDERRTRG